MLILNEVFGGILTHFIRLVVPHPFIALVATNPPTLNYQPPTFSPSPQGDIKSKNESIRNRKSLNQDVLESVCRR